ncbi:MAG: hypothetical protein ACREDR_28580 [Blastocatellia bacterium]
MIEIKMRQPPDGVCRACEGTGIVIPKEGEMPILFGTFCSECDEGKQRWEKTCECMNAGT